MAKEYKLYHKKVSVWPKRQTTPQECEYSMSPEVQPTPLEGEYVAKEYKLSEGYVAKEYKLHHKEVSVWPSSKNYTTSW